MIYQDFTKSLNLQFLRAVKTGKRRHSADNERLPGFDTFTEDIKDGIRQEFTEFRIRNSSAFLMLEFQNFQQAYYIQSFYIL